MLHTITSFDGVIYEHKGNSSNKYPVMDLDRGIVAFPHSFKECHTEMKVVRHHASENLNRALLLFVTQRGWLLFCFKGPHF